jgi:hypothetical protein
MKNKPAGRGSSVSPKFSIAAMLVVSLLGTSLLSGCMEGDAPAPEASAPVRVANMPRRPGVSPTGAKVALMTFGGAPQQLAEQFKASFGQEAKERQITLAETDKANYLIRGYLNAFPEGAGTAVAFVFDVFDAKRQRAQRIEDQISVNAVAADSWSVVDSTALTAIAAKSANDLADFLTNTPEAIAAASGKPLTPVAGDSGQTTVAATLPTPPPRAPAQANVGPGFASLH